MKNLQKTTLVSLSLVTLIGLTACFTDSTTSEVASTPTSALSEVLYDLPSSTTGSTTANALGRVVATENDSNSTIWDAYKPIPAYISMANSAKNAARELIQKVESSKLPENWEGDKDGQHISVFSKDTTINSQTLKVVKIAVSQAEQNLLQLNYLKNEKSEFLGSLLFNDINNKNAVSIRFNTFNQESLGRRMNVIFKTSNSNPLKPNDPTAVQIVTTKTSEKTFISGLSYHPTFNGEFFPEGPSLYAFQVAASNKSDIAVLRAGFGNKDSITTANIFEKYALNRVALRAGQNLIATSQGDTTHALENALMWSLANNKAYSTSPIEALTYKNHASINTLSELDFRKAMTLNKVELLSNPESRQFYLFTTLKQPVYFKKGATLLGVSGETQVNQLDINDSDLENKTMPLILGSSSQDNTSLSDLIQPIQ
jgi:hypothetical protein